MKWTIVLSVISPLFGCSLIFADDTSLEEEPSAAVIACRSYAAVATEAANQCGVSAREFKCQEAEETCQGAADYYRCLEINIQCIDGKIRHNDSACNLDCGSAFDVERFCDDVFSDPNPPQNYQAICSTVFWQQCDALGLFECLDFFGDADGETLRRCGGQSDCEGIETLARCFEFSDNVEVQACNAQTGDICNELSGCTDPDVFDCLDDTFRCENGEPTISPECQLEIEQCFSQEPSEFATDACGLFVLGASQCGTRGASTFSCANTTTYTGKCEGLPDFFTCLNETSLCTDEGWLSFPAYCSEQSECAKETRSLASCISAQQRVQALPCADQAWVTLDHCLSELRDPSALSRNACLQERPRCEGSQLSFECYDESLGEDFDAGFDEEGQGQ